jgi:hypothetical protein
MTAHDKAQAGISLLKEALIEYLATQPKGVKGVQIVEALGLQTQYRGQQKTFLAWSVMGQLLYEGKIRSEKTGRYRYWFLVSQEPKPEAATSATTLTGGSA